MMKSLILLGILLLVSAANHAELSNNNILKTELNEISSLDQYEIIYNTLEDDPDISSDVRIELGWKAYNLAALQRDEYRMTGALHHLNRAHFAQSEYSSALKYSQQSLNLALETGSKYLMAYNFITIGKIHLKLQNYSAAFANLKQGIQIADYIEAKDLLADGYQNLAEYHQSAGNVEEAFEHYRLYAAVTGEISERVNSNERRSSRAAFSGHDLPTEQILKTSVNSTNTVSSNREVLAWLSLLFAGFAIIIISGLFYFQVRQKKKLTRLLQIEKEAHKKTETKLIQRLKMEQAAARISSQFLLIDDFDKALQLAMNEIGQAAAADRLSLYLMAENSRDLEKASEWFASALRFQTELYDLLKYNDHPWLNAKLQKGEIIVVNDPKDLTDAAAGFKKMLQTQSIRSCLLLPINFKQKLAGFISFDCLRQNNKWQSEDLSLLSLFSETIGLFLERRELENKLGSSNLHLEMRVQQRTSELAKTNQELQKEIMQRKQAQQALDNGYRKLKKAMEETVNALVSAVEIRDPYTAGHQLRVASLSREIALAMGFENSELDAVRTAAILHDIGKIYIPTEILIKPGTLTKSEYQLVKNHPIAGYEILKTIDFDRPVAKIVYQHHEHLDGSGYPQGLIGNEIMLEARIVNVADLVDAMISQRPYRNSQGIASALEELQKYAGIRYDEEVVKICLELFNERGFQFEELEIRNSAYKD